MNKTLLVFLSLLVFTMSACSPVKLETSIPSPTNQVGTPSIPQSSSESTPVEIQKQYFNNAFSFGFQFPSNWFGPEEYVSDQTLRVELGSDVVFPYGERPENSSAVLNSYNIVVQFTKNNQNTAMDDTFQALLKLKDGESISSTRSLITRVKQIEVGSFMGFEYIFTLPESAQTDHVYSRNVILLNGQTNDLITVLGQPVNVEVLNGADWREIYQALDEANLSAFRMVVDSLTIN
jgi:hypothetical protein